jgi:hypothetical protein
MRFTREVLTPANDMVERTGGIKAGMAGHD